MRLRITYDVQGAVNRLIDPAKAPRYAACTEPDAQKEGSMRKGIVASAALFSSVPLAINSGSSHSAKALCAAVH